MKKIAFVWLILLAIVSAKTTDAQARPDLYVKAIHSVQPFVDSARGLFRVRVKATIGNLGNMASSQCLADLRVYATPENKPASFYGLPAIGLPGISARKDTLVELIFTDPNRYVTTNKTRVQLLVDSRESVTEANETNNGLVVEITPADPTQGVQMTEAIRTPSAVQVNASIKSLGAFSANFNTPGDFTEVSTQVDFIGSGKYNLDPQNILIQRQNITLKKGGIYHFDIYIQSQLQLKGSTTLLPWIQLYLNAGSRYELLFKQYPAISINSGSAANENFSFGDMVSVDVYIPAGTRISLVGSVSRQGTGNVLRPEDLMGKSFYGYITGYMVKEY